MCEYCKRDPSYSEALNEFLSPLGELERFDEDALGRFIKADDWRISLYLEGDESGAYLESCVDRMEMQPYEKALAFVKVRIHYCPMCGRKLD